MPWYLFSEHEPEIGQMIWILVEEDTCDDESYPDIRKVVAKIISDENGDHWVFELLDWDVDIDGPGHRGAGYLNGNWHTVKAWRAMTITGDV
jgi:hypothetical protein